jgi:hypothetical protein
MLLELVEYEPNRAHPHNPMGSVWRRAILYNFHSSPSCMKGISNQIFAWSTQWRWFLQPFSFVATSGRDFPNFLDLRDEYQIERIQEVWRLKVLIQGKRSSSTASTASSDERIFFHGGNRPEFLSTTNDPEGSGALDAQYVTVIHTSFYLKSQKDGEWWEITVDRLRMPLINESLDDKMESISQQPCT